MTNAPPRHLSRLTLQDSNMLMAFLEKVVQEQESRKQNEWRVFLPGQCAFSDWLEHASKR